MKKQQPDSEGINPRRLYLAMLLFLSIYGNLYKTYARIVPGLKKLYKENNHEQIETNPAGSPDWLPVGEGSTTTDKHLH